MAVPKNKKKANTKTAPIAKDKAKEFLDLFEFKDGKLISKTELTIDGKLYKIGGIITETKFLDFDLLHNPSNYLYIVNKKVLLGRLPKIF